MFGKCDTIDLILITHFYNNFLSYPLLFSDEYDSLPF